MEKDDLYLLGYGAGTDPLPSVMRDARSLEEGIWFAVRFLARELHDLKFGKLEDSADAHVPYLDQN